MRTGGSMSERSKDDAAVGIGRFDHHRAVFAKQEPFALDGDRATQGVLALGSCRRFDDRVGILLQHRVSGRTSCLASSF